MRNGRIISPESQQVPEVAPLAKVDQALRKLVAGQNENLEVLKLSLRAAEDERRGMFVAMALMLNRLGGSVTLTDGEIQAINPRTMIKTEKSEIGVRYYVESTPAPGPTP